MTNKAALQSTTSYPIDGNAIERLLMDRGLEASGEYTDKSAPFDLAKADLYKELVAGASITEGGYSISLSDKKSLRDLANSIYGQYNEPLIAQPVIRGVRAW